MKIILADDVRGLGHRGDTVSVKPGYARNFLFPQGVAYEASDANLRRLSEERKKYDQKMLSEKAVAEEVARKVEGLTIVVAKKAGEEDQLARLARFCEQTGVRPVIDRVLPLAQARDGFAAMIAGDLFGKVVFVP